MTMRLILVASVCLMSACGFAQPRNLVTNGDFAQGARGWRVPAAVTCKAGIVEAELDGAAKALRLELRPRPGTVAWDINLNQPVNAFMDEGDRLEMRLLMRSPQSCRVSVYLEIARDPWTKSLTATLRLTPDWQEYVITGECLADYSPGDTNLGFHLAYDAGAVEMAAVRLYDLDLKPELGGERPTMNTPVSLIENADFRDNVAETWVGDGPERMKVETIDARVGGYDRAVRLTLTPEDNARPWSIGFGQVCAGYVLRGDAVYFQAWMRSPDKCRVSFIYEMADAPHTKCISQLVRLTPEWKEYRFLGRPDRGFRPGQSQAKFFLGYDTGVVEIAGVRVDNYGAEALDSAFDQTIDYWAGREHPDTWRAPALERIERIRKGDLKVKILDADGRPVAGAQVRLVQKRHHFRFGTCLPAGRLLDEANPDNIRFQQEVERLFNTVTFENDLKWPATSAARLQTVERATEWLKQRGIAVRGHCLLWGSYRHVPSPFKALRGQELLDACKSHVEDYAGRMRGKLYLWDVVNEAGSNRELWEEIGWEAFADSFRWARAADPNVLLCYNDYGIVAENPGYRAKVADRIRYLLDHDAPVDVLGIQAHMRTPLTPIHRVLEIMDEWEEFGMDLEITEFDLGCKDDGVHEQYVRDFMIAAFSHPKMTAFILWGFWEGSHWRAKDGGAMFRRDWSKRPAQEAYEDLVLNQWSSRLQATTAPDGTVTLRAFYGAHELTAEAKGARAQTTFELSPGDADSVELRLR